MSPSRSSRTIPLLLLPLLAMALPIAAQQTQGLVSCKLAAEKTGELGCWILASQSLGTLSAPVYWTLDVFPSRTLAESGRTPNSIVIESLGKIWLFTLGGKLQLLPTATRVAEIGPLPTKPGQTYAAQYMEATLEPGMVSRTHLHSGIEVFFTESGETCLETPEGKQIGSLDTPIIIPEGVLMELTATGTQQRCGIMLILHDASRPPTTVVYTWHSKGLCKAGN